jgi:hypothetical protein
MFLRAFGVDLIARSDGCPPGLGELIDKDAALEFDRASMALKVRPGQRGLKVPGPLPCVPDAARASTASDCPSSW